MTCVHMAIKYRFWGADHGAQGYWLGWVLVCVMDFFLFYLFFWCVFLCRGLIDWGVGFVGLIFFISFLFYYFLAF